MSVKIPGLERGVVCDIGGVFRERVIRADSRWGGNRLHLGSSVFCIDLQDKYNSLMDSMVPAGQGRISNTRCVYHAFKRGVTDVRALWYAHYGTRTMVRALWYITA